MKANTYWMYYDGMNADVYRLFPNHEAHKAMHGYGLAFVLYEVLDVHEFSDNDVDLSVVNIVMPEETAGEKNAAADIETELKELLSQTSQKKKKKDINEQQTRKTRFIPVGFSFMSGSDEQKRKGKAPTCRGCNNPILSGESKITHKHKQEPGHTYYSVHQYHCHARCVATIGRRKLMALVHRVWSEREVDDVIDKLRKTDVVV
jgi:hypothetical protein